MTGDRNPLARIGQLGSVGAIRPRRDDALAVLALVLVLGVATAALLFPRVRSDGLAYYMWTEALIRNRTIDLVGPATRYQRFVLYQVSFDPTTQRYTTVFPFGPALLWAPFYTSGLLFRRVIAFESADALYLEIQGDGYLPTLLVSVGTALYSIAAVLLSYFVARGFAAPMPSAAASLLGFFGTPLYYYAASEPTMAHGAATFLVSLVVFLYARFALVCQTASRSRYEPGHQSTEPKATACSQPMLRHRLEAWLVYFLSLRQSRPKLWFTIGFLVGLAGTVRWQLILLAFPLAIAALHRGRILDLLLLVGSAGCVFSTVPLTWLYMFGSASPSALGTVQNWIPQAWDQVLFSPVHGLFTWSPIAFLGVIGTVGLVANSDVRPLGVGLLLWLVIQALMSGAVIDPLAGWSFGMRRMTEVYPTFAIGLAWFLERAGGRSTVLGVVAYLVAVSLALFSVALLLSYVAGIIHPGSGSVVEAMAQWLPPNTVSSLDAIRKLQFFKFGLP